MPKHRIRIRIHGAQRRQIDAEAMVQAIIALGRDMERQRQEREQAKPASAKESET